MDPWQRQSIANNAKPIPGSSGEANTLSTASDFSRPCRKAPRLSKFNKFTNVFESWSQSHTYIVRITSSVFQVLGLALTAWRIHIRLRIRRFWWEDALAAALFFTGLLWIISEWIYLPTNGLTSIIGTWIYSMSFTSVVTLVRMSVLFSIIRIIHGKPRLLAFTYACVAYYVACWVTLITMKVVKCVLDPSWHSLPQEAPVCLLSSAVPVFQLTTDCIAVSILVVLPLRMLWRVKLPTRQRRMILSIFASSVFLAFGALFHTLGQILNISLVMIVGINVEVAISLIVCNLLVVVTYAYRILHRHKKGDDTATDTSTAYDDDFTTPLTQPVQTSLPLTTVDLADYQIAQTTESIVYTSRPPTPGTGSYQVDIFTLP